MTRDVTVELKALRLHGMAGAWADLVERTALPVRNCSSSMSRTSSSWVMESFPVSHKSARRPAALGFFA